MADTFEELGYSADLGPDEDSMSTHTDIEEEDIETTETRQASRLIFNALAYHDPSEILQILLSCTLRKAGHDHKQIASFVSKFDKTQRPLKSIRQAFVTHRANVEQEMFQLLDKGVDLDDVLEEIVNSCDEKENFHPKYNVDSVLQALKEACQKFAQLYIPGKSDEQYWTRCANVVDDILNSLPEESDPNYWDSCSKVISQNLPNIPNWMEMSD